MAQRLLKILPRRQAGPLLRAVRGSLRLVPKAAIFAIKKERNGARPLSERWPFTRPPARIVDSEGPHERLLSALGTA